MLCIQYLAPSRAGTLAASMVKYRNCAVVFIVQTDKNMIQKFVAIAKSATSDPTTIISSSFFIT